MSKEAAIHYNHERSCVKSNMKSTMMRGGQSRKFLAYISWSSSESFNFHLEIKKIRVLKETESWYRSLRDECLAFSPVG
jgi:hypothetical protein